MPSPVRLAFQPSMAAKCSKDLPCSVQSRKLAGAALTEMASSFGTVSQTATTRSKCGNPKGCSNSALTLLKIAVLEPIPRARVMIATIEKPRLFFNWRIPNRISRNRLDIAPPLLLTRSAARPWDRPLLRAARVCMLQPVQPMQPPHTPQPLLTGLVVERRKACFARLRLMLKRKSCRSQCPQSPKSLRLEESWSELIGAGHPGPCELLFRACAAKPSTSLLRRVQQS